MKKIILFLAVATTVLSISCDPYCTYDFYLKNGTNTDLIIDVKPLTKSKIIKPGAEERIDHLGSYTDNAIDRFSPEEFMSSFLELKINEIIMPRKIWQRKYWEYSSGGKSHAMYTLTITDELIETILSEAEEKSE